MWIKASGTRLSEAVERDIFVPVDLSLIKSAFADDNFDFAPVVLGESTLRPSIETLLHGLMEHRFVIHLHLVSALVQLVKATAKQNITDLNGDAVSWGYVDYYKPGGELAREVARVLASAQEIDVVFLANHGVVIGADSLSQLTTRLTLLDHLLGRESLVHPDINAPSDMFISEPLDGFHWAKDRSLHYMVTDARQFDLICNSWALFPDHVVFLGYKPFVIYDGDELVDPNRKAVMSAPFIFVQGVGVLQSDDATSAQLEQLQCFCKVIANLKVGEKLRKLSDPQVRDLIDWDAEKYRRSISR
jgi:rhamnose utilization protein RhaD (predicted bifunctional aldolase and dehydrogenase)